MNAYRKYVQVQGSAVPYISGAKGGCFPAGALVSTPKGATPIETLKIGDKVYCFDEAGNKWTSFVEKTWEHIPEETEGYLVKVVHEKGEFTVTDNHYLYDKDNEYKETKDWQIGEFLTLEDNSKSKILSLTNNKYLQEPVYNLTVNTHHNYICDGIRLSNKGGGGKGGGAAPAAVEDPNTLFSTDILFAATALGEGPVYRINPNGPQDIELNEGTIDDLINIDGDGEENNTVFKTLSTTGTLTQSALPVFGAETVTPQTLQNAVQLKNGNVAGVPAAKVSLQDTSVKDWDKLRFNFIIQGLQKSDSQGNVSGGSLSVKITIFNRTGSTQITSVSKTINGKTNTRFKFQVDVAIPEANKDVAGYKFTVEKTSGDSDSNRVQDSVIFTGWDEIENDDMAYPRTAVIGYALKSFNEYEGSVPTFTSIVKGLLVKVPSNYNQPILSDGEIDWRQLEVPEAGSLSIDGQSTNIGYTQRGYRLQKQGSGTLLTAANPTIYEGIWDGSFTYSWTQNPVWIIYDILTNKTYGLAIPEDNIDKFTFYKVAQYCDACDITDGKFYGVSGLADGTYRNKPNGLFTSVRDTLVGLPRGTSVLERRFITDISITEDTQVMDTLNKITSTFRGLLYYAGGKITLNVDMPDDLPVAVFNDANIEKASLKFFGGRESDILTGCDVSYVDPSNHYRREVVRIDDDEALRERNQIENVKQLDLAGVTRRGQAIRYGQYMLAASKFLRRQVEFRTGTDAISLGVGEVISLSTKSTGVAYGFGGKVVTDSTVGDANVLLEHFTSPAITSSDITGNTLPIGLRVIKQDSDRVDIYLASNTAFQTLSTGNAAAGVDLVELQLTQRFDYGTKTFTDTNSPGVTGWLANNVPQKGDLWTFGEINPDDFYRSTNDKLFKITSIDRQEEELVLVSAVEYVPNVYADADTLISYVPVRYDDIASTLQTPPPPQIELRHIPRRNSDGSVTHDVLVNSTFDPTGYPIYLQTNYEVGRGTEVTFPSISGTTARGANNGSIGMIAADANQLSANESAILLGKNGFGTILGEIPLLCTAVSNPNIGATSNGDIVLTVVGLSQLTDPNFDLNIINVNDGVFSAELKGSDRVTIPINEKSNVGTGILSNQVDKNSSLTEFSAIITSSDVNAETLTITNEHSGAKTLLENLPELPFYVKLNQILDTRYFDARAVYVSGSRFLDVVSNTIPDGSTSFTQPLNESVRFKNQVKLFLDGIEQVQSEFEFTDSTNSSILISDASGYSTVRVETDYYTVPAIEVGDNLEFFAGNVYSVIDTTYSDDSNAYSLALTSNHIYRVQLGSKLLANVSGTLATNITADPVGTVANVSGASFTFDYNTATYPGKWSLANNAVYTLMNPIEFAALDLPNDRLLRNVEPGFVAVKAQNINASGRRSRTTTDVLVIEEVGIQRVQNLELIENLYLEQTVGAVVRITVEFDHIINQEVTDYEISYKLGGEATDLLSFNTVKVSAQGVEDDGKIRFTLNNIDRGLSSSANTITVRVTPLNKTIRGVTVTKTHSIVGKSATPQNIRNFSFAQLGENVHLFWQYETRASGELIDVDLRDIIIKRVQGTLTPDQFETAFVTASEYVIVSAGSTRKVNSVDTYGTFTYLAKTRDTSGNLSTTTVGVIGTTVKLSSLFVLQTYSEDTPGGNVVVGIPNINRLENTYPSFADSATGGLVIAPDTEDADASNGTSSGWSAISGIPTDLLAASGAIYQTKVRDIGKTAPVSLTANIVGTATTATDWNSFHTDVASGVTEVSGTDSILIDTGLGGSEGIGTVLGFGNSAAATVTYDTTSRNNTLISGGTGGNVFAIWNDGQFAEDTSNSNSYALIAGVINADAVALGEVFYANGVSTGGNSFANLTTVASSYKLVDLNQFLDSGSASTTFAGDGSALRQTIQIRTSTTDPFFANGNVDITTFNSGVDDPTSNGFQTFSTGLRNARYFQLRFIVENTSPQEIDYTLDKFEYQVDADSKEFRKRVTITSDDDDGGNTFVDYSTTNFFTTPTIGMTIVSTANVLAAPVALVIGSTETGANINVFFTSNSEPAVGTIVDFTAIGT